MKAKDVVMVVPGSDAHAAESSKRSYHDNTKQERQIAWAVPAL